MSWDDSSLLFVTGSIASELKNLSSQVFHDGSEVDWGSSTYTFGIVTLAKKTVDSSNWELKSSTGATGL